MEKEGLCRVLKYLKQQKVAISIIVTDRHRQINKWLRETHPIIKHFYDVWHIAKGKYNKGRYSSWVGIVTYQVHLSLVCTYWESVEICS